MFDFIPVTQYESYFHIAVLIMLLVAIWQCGIGSVFDSKVASIDSLWGMIFALVLILYMGNRQLNGVYFGDTAQYAAGFKRYMNSAGEFKWDWHYNEWLFQNMMAFFAKTFKDIHLFFTVCAAIYVGSLWWAMYRMFGNYNFIPFLVVMSMFTFWSYGVNGVRNGMGASLFILAMTYVENIPAMLGIAFLGLGMHASVHVMVGAAALAWVFNKSFYYLGAWVLSIVASYAAGFKIQQWVAALNLTEGDDRLNSYLTTTDAAEFLRREGTQLVIGFRWDFIAYSALAVAVGFYFIFRRNFKDEYYHWMYNIFLITNAFWILVIRSSFSNRFAQISWFIMPVILIYPFIKQRFWVNHERYLAGALVLFYAYGFYTNMVPVIMSWF